jgi:RHS repeat-associated protein
VKRYVHGAGIDEILVQTQGSTDAFYHHDALGSTVLLTNASGNIVRSYEYDVFGQVSNPPSVDDMFSADPYANRFLYTGREFLKEANLYDYRNRVYSPDLGRFLQTDPIRFDAGDVNLYRYVSNNPINYTDSSGLLIETIADIGFIAYDLYRIVKDNVLGDCDNLGENLGSLGGNIVGAAIPFATGGGLAVRAGMKSADAASSAARTPLTGVSSLYVDVTRTGSRYANRATDVSKADFEKNLFDSGWARSVSKDGKTIILQKDGAKYVLRDGAKSTGGPTADYYKAGSQ